MTRSRDVAMEPSESGAGEHPEELLDRAVRGALATAEVEALDRHLSACRACAGHLALIRSARAVATPEPWDDLLNRRAIDGALSSMGRGRWPGALSLPFRRWVLVTAGLLLGLGGMAGATWWHTRRPTAAARGRAVASAAAPAVRSRAAAPTALADPAAPPPLGPVPSPAPAAAATPGALDKRAGTQPSAASLFEEASRWRDQNRPDRAVAVFRRLQRLYPRSREARLSFALAGHLLLDGGHAVQALAQFDQHLAQGGEASEEALVGRATALQRMGRPSAESETWRRLLEAYPQTVYAARAKSRLAALDGAPPR